MEVDTQKVHVGGIVSIVKILENTRPITKEVNALKYYKIPRTGIYPNDSINYAYHTSQPT